MIIAVHITTQPLSTGTLSTGSNGPSGLKFCMQPRVARSGPEKAPFARYTRFLAGAAKIIALR